jgi:hypothetical protein
VTRHERAVTMTSATPPVPTQQIDREYVNSETNPRATTRYDTAHTACGAHARVLETSRGGRVVRTCLDSRGGWRACCRWGRRRRYTR